MCRCNSFPQVRPFKPHNRSRMCLLTWGIYGFAQYDCRVLLDRIIQRTGWKGLDGPMTNFYDSTAHFWLSQASRQHWQEFKNTLSLSNSSDDQHRTVACSDCWWKMERTSGSPYTLGRWTAWSTAATAQDLVLRSLQCFWDDSQQHCRVWGKA